MKIFFITISIFCLFCSCKKEKASKEETYNIRFSADALSYVQLPLNKYFIYKDSASGTFDSVVVTQSSLEEKYQPATDIQGTFITHIPAFNYQTFSLLLTKYGTTQEDWFYGQTDRPVFGLYFTPPSDTIYTSYLTLEERVRATNADLGIAFSSDFGNAEYSIIPTLSVEGKTYVNVAFCSGGTGFDSSNANYRRSFYYWVKNIGIVKRIIQTFQETKTYTLVRNG